LEKPAAADNIRGTQGDGSFVSVSLCENISFVIASEAKQSTDADISMDCRVATLLAMTGEVFFTQSAVPLCPDDTKEPSPCVRTSAGIASERELPVNCLTVQFKAWNTL
jgi:hypothetical protein